MGEPPEISTEVLMAQGCVEQWNWGNVPKITEFGSALLKALRAWEPLNTVASARD